MKQVAQPPTESRRVVPPRRADVLAARERLRPLLAPTPLVPSPGLGAFLKLTPYTKQSKMTDDQVYAGVEKALRKYFGKRGDRVVQDNLTCVKLGFSDMKEIPQSIITNGH